MATQLHRRTIALTAALYLLPGAVAAAQPRTPAPRPADTAVVDEQTARETRVFRVFRGKVRGVSL